MGSACQRRERGKARAAFQLGRRALNHAACWAGAKRRRREEGAGPAAGLGRKRERKGKEKKGEKKFPGLFGVWKILERCKRF